MPLAYRGDYNLTAITGQKPSKYIFLSLVRHPILWVLKLHTVVGYLDSYNIYVTEILIESAKNR